MSSAKKFIFDCSPFSIRFLTFLSPGGSGPFSESCIRSTIVISSSALFSSESDSIFSAKKLSNRLSIPLLFILVLWEVLLFFEFFCRVTTPLQMIFLFEWVGLFYSLLFHVDPGSEAMLMYMTNDFSVLFSSGILNCKI